MPLPGAAPGRVPRVPPAAIVTLAVVANLLFASTAALAVAPVPTSRALLDGYDGLPGFLRSLLGDAADVVEGGARGPVGTWLAELYASALAGDPRAQLALQLDLRADVATEAWTPRAEVNLTWRNYGAPLEYRVATGTTATPPDAVRDPVVTTTEPRATLALPPGESWVHVQAAHDGRTGPVITMGPFRSDPAPPPAPVVLGAPQITVNDYHFELEWRAAEAPSGIASYLLERRVAGAWQTVAEVDGGATSHLERNRPNGEYAYRVRAVSGAGLVTPAGAAAPFALVVDAQGNLEPPGTGEWHRGFNAVYDSLLYTYDIHEPDRHATLAELRSGAAGLDSADYALYTADGWGITLDNRTMRQIVADVLGAELQPDGTLVGGEDNALTIGILLFEWLFDATDYDFEKLTDPERQEFLRANETLDAGGGICGDLTALYVTMLRIAGVPARPVHGYLINQGGTTGQEFERGIGGFHMWAEIYVGGDARSGPGGGWIPVDVSGVTGSFDDNFLHVYFGVANPNYLQLGVQDDLGDESLPDDDPRNRWNVWANLGWRWAGGGDPPTVDFQADATIEELDAELGRIWFTPGTGERVWCALGDDACAGSHRSYYDNVKGRSVRSIDYGATVTWTGSVHDLTLTMRYPETTAPTQVAMWTAYQRGPTCAPGASDHADGELAGTVVWTIPGDQEPCSLG